jgi:hypothetical protein
VRWPWRRYPVLRECIVNLKGGETVFRGVVWGRRDGYLVLRNARLLRGKGESVPVDGEVAVPVANVEFMQVV